MRQSSSRILDLSDNARDVRLWAWDNPGKSTGFLTRLDNSFYQEYLGKSLTEKYAELNEHVDKIVHDANSEISALREKIADLQLNQEQLQKKNQELAEIYREKSKKHAQITNLYNLLKSRAMRSTIQTAASESVAQTLQSLGATGHNNGAEELDPPLTGLGTASRAGRCDQYARRNDVEQLHRHQRSGSGQSGQKCQNTLAMLPPSAIPLSFRNNILAATHQHRTRLPQPSNRSVIREPEYRQQFGQQNFRSPNQLQSTGQRDGVGRPRQ
ncbi:hypothetical protein VTO42DRAFT_7708 [Malbranchea cinnamomea]